MTYIIVISLLLLSALFSGLTLGLMGLNVQDLKRKAHLGNVFAQKIYPLRKQGNALLTTLLIGNVAVNAAMSIFLGTLASGFVAGLIATALIVVFGEIIPQALFSRYALHFGALFATPVRVLMYILYPIIKPIAWVLDIWLGDELPHIYSKKELAKIIEEHGEADMSEVDKDEERIITGALTFSDKKVENIMTPRTVVKAFSVERIVDEELYAEIKKSGHSRFPVYKKDIDTIVGILYTAQLIGSKNEGKKITDVMTKQVRFIQEDNSLDDALDMFLRTHKHLCVVQDEFGGVVGVLTLEDILEEILKKEIIDETDKHVDMRQFARENK